MAGRYSFRETAERVAGGLMWLPLALCRGVPARWRGPVLGWIMAWLLAPLAGYRRRALDNLRQVRPDLPPGARKRLAQAAARTVGRQLAELVSPRTFRQVVGRSVISGPGLGALDAARAAGRPVIFVTGHIGNFNAARLAMIARGSRLGVLYRPMRNRGFNRRYVRAMAALSQPMFAQTPSGIRQMLRHLAAGGDLALVADVRAADGVLLDFLGHPARTALTPARLALRHGAELIPVWGLRAVDRRHFDIVVETPIPHADPERMMQAFNDRLSARIAADPGQWFWFHRRWQDPQGTGPDQA